MKKITEYNFVDCTKLLKNKVPKIHFWKKVATLLLNTFVGQAFKTLKFTHIKILNYKYLQIKFSVWDIGSFRDIVFQILKKKINDNIFLLIVNYMSQNAHFRNKCNMYKKKLQVLLKQGNIVEKYILNIVLLIILSHLLI